MGSRAFLVASVSACLLLLAGCTQDPGPVTFCGAASCEEGGWCAAKQDACIYTACGDGDLDAGEACDDGGVADGDVIDGARCSADCTSDESCGNRIWDRRAREVCDPSTPEWVGKCRVDCAATLGCGNGLVDQGEACDAGANGVPTESAACNVNCTSSRCGDGIPNAAAGERCDDGERNGATTCPYGQASCTTCNATCTERVLRAGAYCGDGSTQAAFEACDDGAANGATQCPYGARDCQVCNATCSARVARTGGYCGDGVTQVGHEACDDGNGYDEGLGYRCPYGVSTCTTCSADCQRELAFRGAFCGDGIVDAGEEECDSVASFACGTCGAVASGSACRVIAPQAATGSIRIRSANLVGISFELGDQPSIGSKVFAFVAGAPVTGVQVQVSVAGAAEGTTADGATIAARVAMAIKSSGLNVIASADPGSPLVRLQNRSVGVSGNVRVEVDDPEAKGALEVSGMAGGAGCSMGQTCSAESDCLPELSCPLGARVCW